MRLLHRVVVVLAMHFAVAAPVAHAQQAQASGVLFENVRVFDGIHDALSAPANVLVVGNTIEAISGSPISLPPDVTVQRIEGKGRTLMPGLIDNHWHTMLARPTPGRGDRGRHRLHQSPRRRGGDGDADARLHHRPRHGRADFGLKRAIDEGPARRARASIPLAR